MARTLGTGRLSVRIELATAADDAALRRLARELPMAGRIRLAFECEPSFFAAAEAESDRHHTVIARDEETGEALGMGSRLVRESYVDGEPVPLGYLGQLRLAPAHRGHVLPLLRAGFEVLGATHCSPEAPFDITSIVADNRPARRLLEAGLEGLPRYRPVESLVTFLIPTRRLRAHVDAVDARGGSAAMAPEILDCLERFSRRHQFAPRWTAAKMPAADLFHVALAGGRVVGCLARWDQRAFKQVMVRGYDPALRFWRPLLNLFGAALPRVGEPIAFAHLAPLAVDDDEPAVLVALLRAALAAARDAGLEFLSVGLATRHPLVDVVRRACPGREYASTLYAVEWGDPAAFDGRIAHPEVALL